VKQPNLGKISKRDFQSCVQATALSFVAKLAATWLAQTGTPSIFYACWGFAGLQMFAAIDGKSMSENDEVPRSPVKTDHITILETSDCYEQRYRPVLQASSVMTCIAAMIHLTNRDDVRSSVSGDPLIHVLHCKVYGATFLVHLRPEAHSPKENWSWERLCDEKRYALLAWWIHPGV
jgi:hypothetical protein